MKTLQQFFEDIETRRRELRQRQQDQMASQRERVAGYHAAQQEKKEKESEREELKKEIKRELKDS